MYLYTIFLNEIHFLVEQLALLVSSGDMMTRTNSHKCCGNDYRGAWLALLVAGRLSIDTSRG
jgi:hypothetical protein